MFGLNARAKELVAGIELIARSLSNVRRLARVTDVEAQSLLDRPSTVCAASPAKLPYFRTLLLARIGQSVKCQIGLTSLRKALASRIDPYGGPTQPPPRVHRTQRALTMNSDEFDPMAVMWACLEDIWQLPPAEAAESVSARVRKLDRASRMAVLEAILDEAEGGSFWAIFIAWWPDFEFPHVWRILSTDFVT